MIILRMFNRFLLFVFFTSMPMKKLPQFGGQDIDLYLLYKTVTNFGGWLKVLTFSFYVFHFQLYCLIIPDTW